MVGISLLAYSDFKLLFSCRTLQVSRGDTGCQGQKAGASVRGFSMSPLMQC